jgi:hypothetical protein
MPHVLLGRLRHWRLLTTKSSECDPVSRWTAGPKACSQTAKCVVPVKVNSILTGTFYLDLIDTL